VKSVLAGPYKYQSATYLTPGARRTDLPKFAAFYAPEDLVALRQHGFGTIEGPSGWGWIAWAEDAPKPTLRLPAFAKLPNGWEGREEWGNRFVTEPLWWAPPESVVLAHPSGQLVWLPKNFAGSCLRATQCSKCRALGIVCLLGSARDKRCWPCGISKKGPCQSSEEDAVVDINRSSRILPTRSPTTLKFLDNRFTKAWKHVLNELGL
jgi:hypothetical protein